MSQANYLYSIDMLSDSATNEFRKSMVYKHLAKKVAFDEVGVLNFLQFKHQRIFNVIAEFLEEKGHQLEFSGLASIKDVQDIQVENEEQLWEQLLRTEEEARNNLLSQYKLAWTPVLVRHFLKDKVLSEYDEVISSLEEQSPQGMSLKKSSGGN